MTTKPKARKFRIRRAPSATEQDFGPEDDDFGPDEIEMMDIPDPAPAAPRVTPGRPAAAAPLRLGEPLARPEATTAAERAQSLAERRQMTLERLRSGGIEEAHPTRRPAPADSAAPRPTAAQPAAQARPATAAPVPPRPAQPQPQVQSQAAPRPAAAQPGLDPVMPQRPQPLHPRSLPPRGGIASPLQPMAAEEESVSATPEELDEIRKEGLTGRQLRMARRVAQKHGLNVSSDFDAVRQLRARGVDPFKRANMLEVVPQHGKALTPAPLPGAQLPQTVPADGGVKLPSTEVGGGGAFSPSERRQREIMEIQRDIARRRRRKTIQLMTRLAFFVFLPTLLAGYYYYRIATPMYAAKSEFLILQADATSSGPLGGLLSGTQFATNQDSIAVQSYLQSKDAMVRLDQDQGFAAHFANPEIDPIQRLPANPTTEDTYKVYKKYVQIGYDPTEGVIKMEVSAADPKTAQTFSTQLIDYAEQRVDELSLRKRDDAMKSARESLEKAKEERREAQQKLVTLQEGTLVDPEAVIATLRTQISTYEIQLQEKELQLAALKDNSRPNQARVDGVQADIDRLQELLDRLNKKMTEASSDGASLAADTAQIQMAQADLATADLFLQSALQNEKQTELEANRQVRYLTTSVRPVAPQDPSYPRAFENTILVFLVLSGVYLMISLTGAILREQVSS